MKLKSLIRLIEAVLGLFIGVFWLLYPDALTEPTLVIIASSIVIFAELFLLVKKKKLEDKEIRIKAVLISLILVILLSCISFYFFSKQMESQPVKSDIQSLDNRKIGGDLDSLKNALEDIRATQLADKNNNDPDRKLPPVEEVNEVLDAVGSKLWSAIKTILFWVVIIYVGGHILLVILMGILNI